MKTKNLWAAAIAAFYFLLLSELGTAYILAGTTFVKTAASLVFLLGGAGCTLYAVRKYGLRDRSHTFLVFMGAAMCFAGDVVLCFHFLAGMILFAAGHVLYIAAFSTLGHVGWRTVLPTLCMATFGLCMIFLFPAYEFGSLLVPVAVYAVVISCMFGRACGVALDGTQPVATRLTTGLGALLFVASDFFLTLNNFAHLGSWFGTLCLVTYYPAQYLLTVSILPVAAHHRPHERAQMNVLRRLWCRAFQKAFHIAIPLLPYRQPIRLASVGEAAKLLAAKDKRRALVVTDATIMKLGLCDPLLDALKREGVTAVVYSDTVVNPTVANCEAAATLYRERECDCLIALGGGSAMDCAKGAGARLARPRKTLFQMRGILKVFGKFPLFLAIPTTAGTGSETTIAAVITDGESHSKFTVISFCLAPRYAVLDPAFTMGLPKSVTATTGMDALTHAVEAYIGRSTTRMTRRLAVDAVRIVRANLLTAYEEGNNEHARRRMQLAAYEAGLAFTISYVGYVHAVAHSLGGRYNTPHGLANAVILPHVLRRYGVHCEKRLARLARESGVADVTLSDHEAAETFIAFVERLNAAMGIPTRLHVEERDIPALARHADGEANPLYPVPVLMNATALEAVYHDIME